MAKWKTRYEEAQRYSAREAVEHFEAMMADHSNKVAERHEKMLRHLEIQTEASRNLAELIGHNTTLVAAIVCPDLRSPPSALVAPDDKQLTAARLKLRALLILRDRLRKQQARTAARYAASNLSLAKLRKTINGSRARSEITPGRDRRRRLGARSADRPHRRGQ
jgi:hypothetical protein